MKEIRKFIFDKLKRKFIKYILRAILLRIPLKIQLIKRKHPFFCKGRDFISLSLSIFAL